MVRCLLRAMNNIVLRDLTIADFIRLHSMYDKLSPKSREFFNLYWLGLKNRSLKWYFAQVPLFLSTLKPIRAFMKIFCPHVIFLSKIAVTKSKIVCFGFLIIRHGWIRYGLTAELGVATDEDFRGQGLATKMMEELIEFGKIEGLKEIYLNVRVDNARATSIYEKNGFKKTALLRNEVEWEGKKYNMYKMVLSIN